MSGAFWTEEDLELLGLLNTVLNLPTWATAKLLDRSQNAVTLKRYTEDMPRPDKALLRSRRAEAAERRQAKREAAAKAQAEAYQVASKLPGIFVKHRRKKGTWHFEATIHTSDGRHKRYAGKDVNRAIALRSELIATYAKKAPAAFRLPA